MMAFPEPVRNPPRVIKLYKSPSDHKLAVGVLCYGADIDKLVYYTKCSPEAITEKLNEPAFQTYVNHLKAHPEEVLPSPGEVAARLLIEMETGDRSTDRQRAAETILEIKGLQVEKNQLDKYRRKVE